METQQLLDRALLSFSGSFDITRPAQVASRTVDALAQFRAINEKYVFSRKHVLWEADAFEHALFVTTPRLTRAQVEDWFAFLTREAEPELVHPGAPCPPEGHMYTYLTLVFLCKEAEEDALRALRRLRFVKNYRFSLRGWATGRAVAAVIADGKVAANRDGAPLRGHFEAILGSAERSAKEA